MIQPGKRLTSPQMEEFLSNQNLTARFTFQIHAPAFPPYDKTFQNNTEAYEFIAENPDVIYEFKFQTDYV